MTPFMQDRKYQQLKEEISFYQRETAKKDWRFALKMAFFFVAICVLVELLWNVFFEEQTVTDWLNNVNWIKQLVSVLFWFVIYYFWLVKENHRQLKKKKEELRTLLKQNPCLQEPVS